ncbi:MAG: DNA topoisomerase 4 subunit A [Candidatus Absconditabacteria bacterium]|nr:DNA topoisomerase 4 subunit A [Candidatus Absconditabacteria bacterium]
MSESTPLLGTIVQHPIETEISESYINYAMSVISSRALPDTRDGFKPVLRRILYAMYQMNNFYNQKHKKSARIVGEVMGKYHPHGDSSIYEAMVRISQSWSLRYPLVDGQGNFGSIDGDSPAAMRYTEARLTKIAEEMLGDLEQDTVDRRPNFDGSLQEPIMLPTKFPNHLCNGTMGIAVGMATNMAPHNLNEVLDACLLLLEKEGKDTEITDENGQKITSKYSVSIDDIMEIIKGPDFPTGGVIFDSNNIKEVYKRGKGGIVVRGKTHVETDKHGFSILVIDEIPYLVNKSTLVTRIAELVVDKKIDGVTDIRDESSKNIIRIAIYLRSGIDPDQILVQLFKYTELQNNFNVNNVTLVEQAKQPRLLNIKDLLMEYVVFRRQVVYRRSIFQLNKAKDRLHILEGLQKAINIIDDVIDTIKKSQTKPEAKENLIEKFGFSEMQAEYILMMRLQSLVGLEIQKIIEEIEEKKKLIEYLEGIIGDPIKLDGVVREEMEYMKSKYGDERKTKLSQDLSVYNIASSLKAFKDAADKIKEDVIVWLGNDYSLRVLYQSRIQVIPDETLDLIYTHNQDKLIIITDIGELVVQRLKEFGSFVMKQNAVNLKEHFGLKGKIVFAKTLHFEFNYLVFLTNKNSIKKTKKELVLSFKKFPTTIMKLEDKEKILNVSPVNDGDHLGIITKQGRGLFFKSDDIRPMGKTAGGVKAIELQEGDEVANMFIHKDEPFVLVHSDKNGKLLSLEDLKIRKRARKGQVIMTGNEKLEGGISIVEGAIRIRFEDGSLITLHSNNIRLDEPETPLHKMVDKHINIIYRPWEENEENLKYKEERKKAAKEGEKLEQGLFDDSNKEDDSDKKESTENNIDEKETTE